MLNRRKFVKQSALTAGALLASSMLPIWARENDKNYKLTILHTNDVHSRLDPFPMDGGRNQGLGGVAARAEIIKQIRLEQEHVLLLDAGDIFQGTPYFNMYKGEPEMKAMQLLGYDAATMGNHDFDAGIENFATQMKHIQFPIIISNYDFKNTELENKTQPYKIIKKGPMSIGIFGIGINPKGLIPENLFGNTQYLEPIEISNKMADFLKNKKGCDMVICLSHLGFKYNDSMVSDIVLAKETSNIDLIIGGHTHTFLSKPVTEKNKQNKDVLINQVGWGGINLGRLDFSLKEKNKNIVANAQSVIISNKSSI